MRTDSTKKHDSCNFGSWLWFYDVESTVRTCLYDKRMRKGEERQVKKGECKDCNHWNESDPSDKLWDDI